jgi:hypothetical protein
MSEFSPDFWIAIAAGAPVVALAAVVQVADAGKTRGSFARVFYELESAPPVLRKLYMDAQGSVQFAINTGFINIFVQAGLFTWSLIVLGQHRYIPTPDTILVVAYAEGAGVLAVLLASVLTINSSNAINAYYARKDVTEKPRRKHWWEIDRGNGGGKS